MDPSNRKPAGGSARQSLGRRGESLAAEYLAARGYRILERNFRSPYGEIDLVAYQPGPHGACLVFVEVKTRSSNAYGYPEQAITASKQVHLIQSAQAYLQEHPDLAGDWRIDVIAVRTGRGGGRAEIEHIENAVH